MPVEWAEFTDVSGLMAYGPSAEGIIRRLAEYVDRIFSGGKPQDLPVEQPTKFELVINLNTAKALGLTQATLAVKNATATTPVVFVGAGDPVATEMVESLSRPGRNITGLSVMSTELSGKWRELLREAVPRRRSPDGAARDRRPLGGWL